VGSRRLLLRESVFIIRSIVDVYCTLYIVSVRPRAESPIHTLNFPSASNPLIRIMASSSSALKFKGSSPTAISLYFFSSLPLAEGRLAGGGGIGFGVSDVRVTTLITVKTIAARMAAGAP
jgi:hypothetical protein